MTHKNRMKNYKYSQKNTLPRKSSFLTVQITDIQKAVLLQIKLYHIENIRIPSSCLNIIISLNSIKINRTLDLFYKKVLTYKRQSNNIHLTELAGLPYVVAHLASLQKRLSVARLITVILVTLNKNH